MKGLISEITDEGSSADGTIIYISVHRWSKYDKVPCLNAIANPNAIALEETSVN